MSVGGITADSSRNVQSEGCIEIEEVMVGSSCLRAFASTLLARVFGCKQLAHPVIEPRLRTLTWTDER